MTSSERSYIASLADRLTSAFGTKKCSGRKERVAIRVADELYTFIGLKSTENNNESMATQHDPMATLS